MFNVKIKCSQLIADALVSCIYGEGFSDTHRGWCRKITTEIQRDAGPGTFYHQEGGVVYRTGSTRIHQWLLD